MIKLVVFDMAEPRSMKTTSSTNRPSGDFKPPAGGRLLRSEPGPGQECPAAGRREKPKRSREGTSSVLDERTDSVDEEVANLISVWRIFKQLTRRLLMKLASSMSNRTRCDGVFGGIVERSNGAAVGPRESRALTRVRDLRALAEDSSKKKRIGRSGQDIESWPVVTWRVTLSTDAASRHD